MLEQIAMKLEGRMLAVGQGIGDHDCEDPIRNEPVVSITSV